MKAVLIILFSTGLICIIEKPSLLLKTQEVPSQTLDSAKFLLKGSSLGKLKAHNSNVAPKGQRKLSDGDYNSIDNEAEYSDGNVSSGEGDYYQPEDSGVGEYYEQEGSGMGDYYQPEESGEGEYYEQEASGVGDYYAQEGSGVGDYYEQEGSGEGDYYYEPAGNEVYGASEYDPGLNYEALEELIVFIQKTLEHAVEIDPLAQGAEFYESDIDDIVYFLNELAYIKEKAYYLYSNPPGQEFAPEEMWNDTEDEELSPEEENVSQFDEFANDGEEGQPNNDQENGVPAQGFDENTINSEYDLNNNGESQAEFTGEEETDPNANNQNQDNFENQEGYNETPDTVSPNPETTDVFRRSVKKYALQARSLYKGRPPRYYYESRNTNRLYRSPLKAVRGTMQRLVQKRLIRFPLRKTMGRHEFMESHGNGFKREIIRRFRRVPVSMQLNNYNHII